MNQSVDDVCRGEFEPVAVFEFVIGCGADLEGHSVADLERRERCLAVLIGGWDLQCLNEPCQARYPWTVVDPVLFRGDREYDVGRVLWSRLDELPEDRDVFRAFDAFVDAADVPADRARAWVVVRSMSYLVWGLARGLTWDPPKCIRLLGLFS